MRKTQKENTAKYLYDISKITFTLAVLGNFLAREKFDPVAFSGGIVLASLTFALAYLLDGKEG